MKTRAYKLTVLCIIVFIIADIGLDIWLKEISIQARIWLGITVTLVFMAIGIQIKKNVTTKNK